MNTGLLVFGFLAIMVPIFFVAVSEMKRIKKTVIICLLIFVGAVNAFMYMEARFGTLTGELSDLTAEEILDEMPDIAITEEDVTMMKELLESEIIAEAFLLAEEEEYGWYDLPWDESVELLGDRIPEGFEMWNLHVSAESVLGGKEVNLSFQSCDEPLKTIYYWFDSDFEHLQKTVGVYGKDIFGDQSVTVYDNINGEITKWEDKRVWFDWMRKRFAPVEVNLPTNYKLDVTWNGEDITSQLSAAEMEEIRQVLETASCNRRWYEATSFSVDENMVAISVRNESDYSDFVHFCFSGSEEKYTFQSTERTYRIRNGEEMLRSIMEIILE